MHINVPAGAGANPAGFASAEVDVFGAAAPKEKPPAE